MRQPRFVKISSKKSVCFVLFMVVKYNAEFIMERSCQMIETNGKKLFRGEAALALAVLINSFGVVLMLYSGALILSLMIMRKKFVTSYLFSFAVGFVFSELLDVHELWINVLPSSLAWRIVYFILIPNQPIDKIHFLPVMLFIVSLDNEQIVSQSLSTTF